VVVSLAYHGSPIGGGTATAVTDAAGLFSIDVTGLGYGTNIYVYAEKAGYTRIDITGAFDQKNEQVDFTRVFVGPDPDLDWEDRRLPTGMPMFPLYFGLLPD
jgi:hypothetical protein